MAERTVDRKGVIAQLIKSPHGALQDYVPVGITAAEQDADFFAHLTSWNHRKGQVRDAQIAFPIIALKALYGPIQQSTTLAVSYGDPLVERYAENACAHLADLGPREFVRAINFGWDLRAPTRLLKRLAIRYLRNREADPREWERVALQHRASLRWLYAQMGVPVRISGGESAIFGRTRKAKDRGAEPMRFRVLKELPGLSPLEIASLIDRYKLPFLVTRGALGEKAKDPDVALALLQRMSPGELVTNMRALRRLGVENVPALRAALEQALEKAGAKRGKAKGTLKATRAAEALVADDPKLAGKLRVLQEKQIAQIGGVEGNWLVAADKSASMEAAMEAAKLVAATLARVVKGRVHLVFFDTDPRYFEVTGYSLEQIQGLCAGIRATGGTRPGVALLTLAERGIAVDGIALVSDGCENQAHLGGGYFTAFGTGYTQYVSRMGLTETPPTCYWYRMPVTVARSIVESVMRQHVLSERTAVDALRQAAEEEIRGFLANIRQSKVTVDVFDLSDATVDYHSVVNLVPTMRAARYALLDEIYATPLRTLDDVLTRTAGMPVLPQRQVVHV